MMRTFFLVVVAVLSLLALPQMALANHDGDKQTGCCKDGSSPWASQSKDAWQPSANGGYY